MTETTTELLSADHAQTPPAEGHQEEKLIPQSQVNKIVGDAKASARRTAYEDGKRDALAELQINQSQMQPPVQQPPMQQAPQAAPQGQPAPGMQVPMGNMNQGMSSDEIQRRIDEGVQRHVEQQRQHADWQQTVNSFMQKASSGPQKYDDFDQVVAPLQLDKNTHLVTLTNLVDNTADVLHDLGKNPEKVAILNELSRTNPQLAIKKMQDLSNSIKTNQAATQQQSPNEPLSQLKPSTVTTDNGSRTVSDLRRSANLRV